MHVLPLDGPETYRAPDEPISRETVEQWVCSLYAGFAAAVRVSPESEAEERIGARGDDEQAAGESAGGNDSPGARLRRFALHSMERSEL